MDLIKTCSKCGAEKPASEAFFYKQKDCRDGLRPDCKVCFYRAHKARLDANPEEATKYRQAYREKNRTYLIQCAKVYYKANRERFLEKAAEYNRKNKDAYLAKLRKWRKEHPEQVQVWVRNRRAKLKGLQGSHTHQDILALLKAQGCLCVYCRTDIRHSFQVDHIFPLSKGGRNDKENLQLLCKSCNLRKRARDPIEFAQSLGRLI